MSPTITPYFTVQDADRLIDFLIRTFDGVLVRENRYADGRMQHARVQIGDSLLMINSSTENYPANISQMHIVVADADAVYDGALRQGATSIMEPNDRPHGERMAGLTDPCGNIWWIASQLPSSSA